MNDELDIDFHDAVRRGDKQTVATLIIGGSDVNGPDDVGIRPIHWATIFGRTNLIPVLGDAGAKIDAQDPYGYSPLHIAVWSGDMDMVTALVAEGAQLEAVNKIGETPLQWAQRNGQVSITKLLLAIDGNTSLGMERYHCRRTLKCWLTLAVGVVDNSRLSL